MNCLQSDVNKMLIFIGMPKRLACPKRWSKGSTIFVAFGSKMGPKSSQWCCMPFKQASQQSGMGAPIWRSKVRRATTSSYRISEFLHFETSADATFININQGDFQKWIWDGICIFHLFLGAWSVFMEFGNHNHASIFFCQRTVSYLDFRKKIH